MKYIIACILAGLSLFPMVKAQQTQTQNYVLSRTYKQAGASENNVSLVDIQVQYMDGLGRKIQDVAVKQSPAGTDVIQQLEYDQIGRPSKNFLPYTGTGSGAFHGSASTEVSNWYTANSALLQNYAASDLTRPYVETYFEQVSNRETGRRAPGGRSAGSAVQYKVNGAADVKRYDYTGGTIVQNGHYAAGTLTDIQTTDEQGHDIHEYTNKSEQLICRYQVATGYTYYVYDDLGLLRAVLQPNLQDDNSLTNSAYLYDYDERNRLIKKQIPGAGNAAPGVLELVYDQFDRPVLSRDGNQKARNVWGFTKYDALNRAVITGEIASTDDRTTWVTTVNTIAGSPSAEHHEIRDNAVTEGYTLNKTVPTNATLANLLTITFYDNYAFSTPSGLSFTTLYYTANNANVKGLPTGGRVKMLPGDSGTPESWLTNVTYYDAEYRPIQTVRQLFDLGAAAVERVSILYKYDLAAVIAEQKTEQTVSSGTNSTLAVYSYDHADRLLGVKETVAFGSKSKTAHTLAQRYNTLGQLQSKWFHAYPANDGKYRVKTNHTNNIRGWLTGAESLYQKKIGEAELPYYAFSLAYANGAVPASSNYTNGNISQMKWSDKDESTLTKGLNFAYDNADRLTESTGLGSYADTEGGITYDKNGNIKSLQRAGAAADNLTYTYTGNQLSAVNDASGNNSGIKNGASSYSYDNNGNMTFDGNRGATISYNYLNLPRKVTIGSRNLVYDYDASGTKHKYYDLTAPDTVNIKYTGVFEYDGNNELKRVFTSSGQVQRAKVAPSPASDTLRFDYFLKDHLGNVRVVFDESGKIIQRSDYYPYGLAISRDGALPSNARNGINRYLYNGKEQQIGTGFVDYGARMSMPEIGRWGTSDPLNEKSRRWSTFNYCQDNPLKYIDPDGRAIIKIDGGVRFTGDDIAIAYNAVLGQVEESGDIRGIHFVQESKTPTIYQHTLNAFRAGKPSTLHYDSDKAAKEKRRYQALKAYPLRGSEGLQRDEYPYASTFEGGAGAMIAYVPSKENNEQGRDLSALYRTLKSGDGFVVFPVPSDTEPSTNPVAVPVTHSRPLITPRDVGVGIVIGVGAYEALKWATAIFLIPETGGASIPAAAALP